VEKIMGQPSKEAKQRWLDANKEKRPTINRNCRLRTYYGISPEEYDEMLLQQNNRCAICKREFEEKPHLDHEHGSGWVRGILCNNCNLAIGLFEDDVVRIQEAVEYLIANVPPPEFNIFLARERLKKKPSYSVERKANLRASMLGNTFREGIPAWNSGKPWSEENRKKMSDAAKLRWKNMTQEQLDSYRESGKKAAAVRWESRG